MLQIAASNCDLGTHGSQAIRICIVGISKQIGSASFSTIVRLSHTYVDFEDIGYDLCVNY